MKIIAVDDEQFALNDLVSEIKAAEPRSIVNAFSSPQKVLEFARKNDVDIAFLDIEMRGMNGLLLAKLLKEINSKINIVFVTGFSQYALDAVSVRCSGYLLKPVSVQAIRNELLHLRNPVPVPSSAHVQVQTFGGFEVFVGGNAVNFSRAKSKEVLAYLVNKKGVSASTREVAAILWEDKEYSITQQSYFQTIVADLLSTLKNVGAEEIIIKKRNSLAIDTEKIDCDYYNFQKGNPRAVNSYAGNYMSNYSWAEFTVGYLEQINDIQDEFPISF